MSLDDRDYYRQELASKSGGRPPQRLGHRPACTPLEDRVVDEQQVPAQSHGAADARMVRSDGNYLEELARRLQRTRRWKHLSLLQGLTAACAILIVMASAAPLVMTPRATYVESWQALTEQMTGNMHCTRIAGFVIYVRLRLCGDSPTGLPIVQSPNAPASR